MTVPSYRGRFHHIFVMFSKEKYLLHKSTIFIKSKIYLQKYFYKIVYLFYFKRQGGGVFLRMRLKMHRSKKSHTDANLWGVYVYLNIDLGYFCNNFLIEVVVVTFLHEFIFKNIILKILPLYF